MSYGSCVISQEADDWDIQNPGPFHPQTQLTLLPAHCVLAAHSLSSLLPQCVTITGLPGGALRARRALNLSMQAQRPSGSVCKVTKGLKDQ
ncbi:unnamed protein product [Rangifer tarandus platyrhynchus]|uniref:Uncharacterized protein n=1 Tax=Rangifer tarandus platyrhynchus TaxID=3082113 RepID=A0AC60A519_RANTA